MALALQGVANRKSLGQHSDAIAKLQQELQILDRSSGEGGVQEHGADVGDTKIPAGSGLKPTLALELRTE